MNTGYSPTLRRGLGCCVPFLATFRWASDLDDSLYLLLQPDLASAPVHRHRQVRPPGQPSFHNTSTAASRPPVRSSVGHDSRPTFAVDVHGQSRFDQLPSRESQTAPCMQIRYRVAPVGVELFQLQAH